MIRGSKAEGTVAPSSNDAVAFGRHERIKSVIIYFPSGTPTYAIRPDDTVYTGSREYGNANYISGDGLISEHTFDYYCSSVRIINNHGSLTLTYRIFSEEIIP